MPYGFKIGGIGIRPDIEANECYGLANARSSLHALRLCPSGELDAILAIGVDLDPHRLGRGYRNLPALLGPHFHKARRTEFEQGSRQIGRSASAQRAQFSNRLWLPIPATD